MTCDSKEKSQNGDSTIRIIGKINMCAYKAVSPDIRTDEVIITYERIMHIKDGHSGDFECYSQYIPHMLSDPQYILADRDPSTAIVLQEFSEEHERFRLVLKLAVKESEQGRKNSVITFLKINEKTYNKYLRNKKILYSSE